MTETYQHRKDNTETSDAAQHTNRKIHRTKERKETKKKRRGGAEKKNEGVSMLRTAKDTQKVSTHM